MGIVIRQWFKGTIVAYLGVLIGAFNLLYLFPKLLSPEEIGLTKVLLELSLLLSGIAQIGTSGIIDRFFPMFKDEDKKHNGFFVLVLFYPIIGFLVLCVAFLLAKEFWLFLYESKSPLLVNYYYYLIPFTFFCIYHAVLESYIRAQYRIVVPLVIKEIFLRVFFSAVTILYYFDIISLEIFISLIIFSYALAVFTLVFYLKLLHKLYLNGFSIKNNKISIRQMGKFSLIAISSGTLGLIASKIDVILISSNIGLKTTAVYAIAFYIATVIEIPRRSISLICIPIVASFWKNNNLPGIKDLYARVALNQLIIGLFIFLLIWCNVDFILKIIPNR